MRKDPDFTAPPIMRLRSALTAVLPSSVGTEVRSVDGKDMVINLAGRDLLVSWVGRASKLEVARLVGSGNPPEVIVGSELSEGARKAASEAGVGWVDETGSAEIVTDGIVVSRSSERRPRAAAGAKWTPSTLGVAEALLGGTTPTVGAVSAATGHAPGTAATALRNLEALGLLEASASRGRNSGRRVIDERTLLESYAAAAAVQDRRAELRCGALWQDPISVVKRLGAEWDQHRIAWSATGALAAMVVAPYLTEVNAGAVYVDAVSMPDLLERAREAGVTPMEGGRLLLRPFPTSGTRQMTTEVNGLRVAPWARIYADLRGIGVRGEDAAEHLWEVVNG